MLNRRFLHVPLLAALALPCFLRQAVQACSEAECAQKEFRSASLIQTSGLQTWVNDSDKRSQHEETLRAKSRDHVRLPLQRSEDNRTLVLPSFSALRTSALHEDFNLLAALKVSSFLILTIFCLVYELQWPRTATARVDGQQAGLQPPPLKKPRLPLWDIMRFVLEFTVIYHHLHGGENVGLEKGINPFQPPCSMPSHEFLDTMERSFRPLRMGGFAMLSGVFGASMAWESVSKMLCYTMGTTCLAGVFYSWSSLNPVPVRLLFLWYLVSILVWRLTITPMFYALRDKLGMPSLVPLIASNVMLYLARHLQLLTLEQGWYGIMFAAALCLSANDWTKLLLHPGTLVGAVSVLSCYFGTIFLTPLDPWLCDSHVPTWVASDPITFVGFMKDTALGAVQICLALSALAILANASTVFSKTLPSCCEFVAGCGSRTLYAYVLHMWVVHALNDIKPDNFQYPPITFPIWLNVVLSMRGTEYLFSWLLLPYWILDLGAWVTTTPALGQKG